MPSKTVCVLGGGIGGVAAAARLKKLLKDSADVKLFDKSPDHIYAPSFLWILTGQRKPEQVKRSLSGLKRKGVDFINAEITRIDPAGNTIHYDGKEINYDYLIVALGADTNMSAIDGLSDAAINVYSLDGILLLKDKINNFDSGELVILIPSMPYKCPAAPYETAFLLDHELRQRKVRSNINISIYTFEPLPMPTAGPQIGQAIKEFLDSRGIDFFPQVSVKSVDPRTKELIFADDTRKKADLIVTIPPHTAPKVVKETDLSNEAGWIPVDNKTLATKYPNVFAIGDISAVKLEGKYKPDKPLMLPKAGIFAHLEAELVADNIAAEIKGTGQKREFDGKGGCFLELGGGVAAYADGNFYNLPHPNVEMKKPSRMRHFYKVFYEKYWFWRFF